MIKPQDVIVLLKIGNDPHWSFPQLSNDLGFSPSALHRSLHRAEAAGLYDPSRKTIRSAALEEFLIHALKFLAPPRKTGETRGIPTAWDSPRLKDKFAPSERLPLVWPYALGEERGIGLEPLHPGVPQVAARDPEMAWRLALVDALRLGDARLAEVATQQLRGLINAK